MRVRASNARFRNGPFPSANLTIAFSSLDQIRGNQVVITGLVLRRSLYDFARKWHRRRSMTELRELRRAADLSQQEFAALMSVPVNTFRMWDSGLRPAPLDAVQRARLAVAEHARNTQFVSLDQLARELGVHVRTLRAAARTGRLVVQFSSRSAFGRPIRFATRSAASAFMERYYQTILLADRTTAITSRHARPAGLCQPATAGPASPPANARAARRRDRRSKQGRRLSMGVSKAETIPGVLAEDRRVGEDICHRSTPCAYLITF